MEVNHQAEERGGSAEDRWREIFDKVFAQLRADYPADEWTLRIVDQLNEKAKLHAENPESNAELITTEVIEEIVKSETKQAEEAAPENDQQVESIEAPAEASEGIESSGSTAPLVEVNDIIGLLNVENLAQVEQSIQEATLPSEEPLASQHSEEPVTVAKDVPTHDGQAEVAEPECQSEHAEVRPQDARGEDVAQAVDQGQQNEVPLATLHDQTNEDVVKASDDQQRNEQEVAVNGCEEADLEATPEGLHQSEVAQLIETETLQAEATEEEAKREKDVPQEPSNEEALEPDAGCVQAVLLQTPPDDLEPLPNESTEQPEANETFNAEGPAENGSTGQLEQESAPEESQECETIRMYAETRMFISTAPDLPRTDMDIEPPSVEVTLNGQENYKVEPLVNGDAYDEPEKQIDELEIKPTQVVPGSPKPDKTERASQTPQRPSSPPAKKEQQEEHSRKPEWMRRPLVRKGSVGRFLGRMKETMQSKRFHPDRLPVVVPPPLPEPPKRPPRRKTLHNLDLTREALGNTSTEQSQVEPVPTVQTTPPPQPAAASETDNRSNTLRSTTSERRRKNSVGRFLGKVLSTKQVNQSESGTAAEEAPLLQDPPNEQVQQQTVISSVAVAPARSVSPTPAPSEKSKKLPHASLTDVSQYFRRILRSKTPTHDDVKSGRHVPERPPPPHPQSNDDNVEAEDQSNEPEKKNILKQGKVHFKCQKCHHQWRSAKGSARFEIAANQVGDGICHGEVLVRLYGQQCNRCPVLDAPVFELAAWSVKEVERVLTEILVEVSRRHYPGYPRRPETDERGRRAHQRRLCQACQEGVCQIKAAC